MEDSGGARRRSSSPPTAGGAEADQTQTHNNNNKNKKPDVENKSKRKLKTAYQLEVLEKTYSEKPYPSEAVRVELSEQLGLTDKQLQMWFCHRRVKDRKGLTGNRQRKDSPSPRREEMEAASEACRKHSPASDYSPPHPRSLSTSEVAVLRNGADLSTAERYYEPRRSVAELRAMSFVEEQLEVPMREDGPVLGVEFDPLPPDAFSEPMRTTAIVMHETALARHLGANMYDQYDLKSIKQPKWLSRDQWSSKRRSLHKQQMRTVNTSYQKYNNGSESDS